MSAPTPANLPLERGRALQFARFTALLLLFTLGAWAEVRHLTALQDVDVWWRLRTGLWIAQNHALPHHALFTRYVELPWTVSGWFFDLLMAAGYSLIGIAALPMAVMLSRCVLAIVLFVLAGGGTDRPWLPAVLIAALALWLVGPLPCGPLAVSVLFYGVELALLLHAQRSGNIRFVYVLPVFFFLWANLAPEFVWGFLPLIVLIAVEAAQIWIGDGAHDRLPLPMLTGIGVASVAAPLLAPYSYHLYSNFFAELYNFPSFKYFPQMHALAFRQPHDFVLALFLFGAFFAIGRRRNLFLSLVLLLTLPIAFRAQRDVWLAILPAVATFAQLWQTEEVNGTRSKIRSELVAAAAVSIIAVAAGGLLLLSPSRLEQRVAAHFPVQAAEYVRSHKLPAPLFHFTDWGGFLTYALPEYPVAMDDRVALYGDSAYLQMRQVAEAEVPLGSVPAFTEARTLLLPADCGLAKALTLKPEFRPHYRVAYQDGIAVVLEAQ
jgi:hypothetical protein